MKNLDLVIACALGMPTWVAVRFASESRYMLNRDTCPWYPTMRLFRQERIEDWESVFSSMAIVLQKMNKSLPLAAKIEHQ